MSQSAHESPSHHENRIRWRLIPATLMTLFGALLLVLSIINLVRHLSGFRPFVVHNGAPLRFIAGTGIMTIAAGVLFARRQAFVAGMLARCHRRDGDHLLPSSVGDHACRRFAKAPV